MKEVGTMGEFASEISKILTNESFERVAHQSLIEIFGENNTQSLIFHMGGHEVLKSPDLFERKIKEIFKDGAYLILNHVKYNVTRNVHLSTKKINNPRPLTEGG